MFAKCPMAPVDLEPYRPGEELYYLTTWHEAHDHYDHIVANKPTSMHDIAFVIAYELYNSMESTVVPVYEEEILACTNMPLGVKWWALAKHVGLGEFRSPTDLKLLRWLEENQLSLHEDEWVRASEELAFIAEILE
jgi:hypothetical protein